MSDEDSFMALHSRSTGCRYRSGHMPVLGVRSADQAGHWREHFGAYAAVEKMQGPVEKIEPANMTPQQAGKHLKRWGRHDR
jgi:hypothetical protein